MNQNAEAFTYVAPSQITPNPHQPRKRFKQDALQQLAQSIEAQGIIQPLIVRPSVQKQDHYELVAGERRWRALQMTSIQKIPVVIRHIVDADLLEVALLENIQREDLNPVEEAKCYQQLLVEHRYTQEVLARRIGKDRSSIANTIRLLSLPTAIQNDLEEARLSMGHARALLALPTEELQMEMRDSILKHRWSVRETEQQVRQVLAHGRQSAPRSSAAAMPDNDLKLHLQNLETELEQELGTRVQITFKHGKGQIRLHYHSLDDFEQLYEALKSQKK